MAAIVRIKRRRDEDPQDLLLLSCKKNKTNHGVDSEDTADQKAVFKFAGTVSSKEVAVSKPVREAIRKEKLEKEFKQHQVNLYGGTGIRQQTRLEHKQSAEKSRYRVISSHRALNLDNLDEIDDGVDEKPDIKQTDKPNKDITHSVESNASVCKLCGKTVPPQTKTNGECDCVVDSVGVRSKTTDNATEKGSDKTKETLCDTDTKSSDKNCDKISNGSASMKKECSGDSGPGETDRKMFCLLDVETDLPTYQSVLNQLTTDQITCNSEPMTQELAPERGSDEDYVYDLYYINNQDFDFRSLENGLTLEAMSEDRLYAGGLSDDDEFVYEDEDDENNENNWRNDYPDEDPGFVDHPDDDGDEFYGEGLHEIHAFESGQDNQLAEWMSWRCNIEDNTELSSDDDLERYETGPTYSDNYYKYVREAVDGVGSESDDGTELPCL